MSHLAVVPTVSPRIARVGQPTSRKKSTTCSGPDSSAHVVALDARAMIFRQQDHVRDGDHAASMGKTLVRLMRRMIWALPRQAAYCSTAPRPGCCWLP